MDYDYGLVEMGNEATIGPCDYLMLVLLAVKLGFTIAQYWGLL